MWRSPLQRLGKSAPLRFSPGAAFFIVELSGMLTVVARNLLHFLLHKSPNWSDITTWNIMISGIDWRRPGEPSHSRPALNKRRPFCFPAPSCRQVWYIRETRSSFLP